MPDKPERSHSVLPTRDDASTAPAAACFVGSTLVDTTRGRVKIEDLAALSDQRDLLARMFTQHLAQLAALIDRQLEVFDASATVLLSSASEGRRALLQTALLAQREVQSEATTKTVESIARECAAHLADMLPRVLAYDTATGALVERSIVKAWAPHATKVLVDVAIGVPLADAPHTIRCTPGHSFITPGGEVEAQELADHEIYRVVGGKVQKFIGVMVERVELWCPVAVFDLEVEGVPSYCVSPDSSAPSVVVHNSAFVGKPPGLKIDRVFDDVEDVVYETRKLTDPATGEAFDFDVPATWSDQAATILATKYARKAGVPVTATPWLTSLLADPHEPVTATMFGGESSARQIFGRLAGAWAYWGRKLGYFDLENAERFRDELTAMLAQQVAAPNSPQWFNTGLHWAYGITGKAQGHYAAETQYCKAVYACPDSYTRPQVHACFIQSVNDDLVGEGGITDLLTREARLFKFGSGTGSNFSALREKGAPLSSGGSSSGLISFLKVLDRSAGAIKSGGTTRRAARMVTVDIDHPDVGDYIAWKPREEAKIEALRAAGFGDASNFEDEASETVSGQNANHSVRVTDAFMQAVEDDGDFDLVGRVDGKRTTVKARDLWGRVCNAAWSCADPGLQFHDTINARHTCPTDGDIVGSNPCSEYMFLDDTACNLASLNLVKFLRADGTFDEALYQHAVRLWTIVLDISVSMAGYPSEKIAQRSMEYRTLGLGYANLGGALMRKGIPYDSDDGRKWCTEVTSMLGAYSWQASAELSKLLGPFPAYERNSAHVIHVLDQHYNAAQAPTHEAWNDAWNDAICEVGAHGARNAQTTLLAPTGTISFVMDCDSTGIEPVYALEMTKRLAGGGSMSITCPAAEAYLNQFFEGPTIAHASLDPVLACANDISWLGHLGMMAAAQPFLCGAISKTVNMPSTATASDISEAYKWAWEHGLKAVAVYRDKSKATQVLTTPSSESIEVTVDATASEVASAFENSLFGIVDQYAEAASATAAGIAERWHMPPDPKILIADPDGQARTYRVHANGDLTPTDNGASNASPAEPLPRGVREPPPSVREGTTVKLKIAGHTHYVTINRYDDGRLSEVFIETGKTGGTVRGWATVSAIMLSFYLQAGGQLEDVIEKLRFQRFEPAGFVTDAPLGVRQVLSPVDGVAQLLTALSGATPPPLADAVGVPVSVAPTAHTNSVCSNCHGTNLQAAGACLTCRDCGATTGCG